MEIKPMITEGDIRTKSDEELLDIWAKQNEYVPEMIPWVKAEIERRHLDTSRIHVRPSEEIKAEEERESDRDFVRMAARGEGVTGLLLLLVSLVVYEATPDSGLAIPFGIFAFGALLIVYAVGVWREKKWAIVSGLVLYSITTIMSAAVTILVVWGAVGRKIERPFLAVAVSLGSVVVSGGIALAFNRLRTRRLEGPRVT